MECPYDWTGVVAESLARRRAVDFRVAVGFFERVFENTAAPARAWFGSSGSSVGLVVGGIYLAALVYSGARGIWLLSTVAAPRLSGFEYRPVKSAKSAGVKSGLLWTHSAEFARLEALVDESAVWESYADASQRNQSIWTANDRDLTQIKYNKIRLSEFYPGRNAAQIEHAEEIERRFQAEVAQATGAKQAEARRRRLAVTVAVPGKRPVLAKIWVFPRNPDVVAEVLDRANGMCEDCGNCAPFHRKSDNSPYLEVHHVRPLAEGGPDTVANAKAICPNCHRKAHFG